MIIKPEDFIVQQNFNVADLDYGMAEALVNQIRDVSLLTGKCFTIFDYYKNEYLFVPDNTGYFSIREDGQKPDYMLLINNAAIEDIYFMLTVQKKAFLFLHELPMEERTKYVVTLNVRMFEHEKKVDTTFKVKAQVLDSKGNVWLSLAEIENATEYSKPRIVHTVTGETHYFKPLDVAEFSKYKDPLTKKELAILDSMAKGHSVGELCNYLDIKEPTYKRHRSEIYRKLNVESKIAAVNRAFMFGIIK